MTETATKADSKRDRVFLKNGNGSVAAADFDEKVHGKAAELTDEQYQARVFGHRPGYNEPNDPKSATPGVPPVAGVMIPGEVRTTIVGLHSADPGVASTPATPAPPAISMAPVGKKVAVIEDEQKPTDTKTATSK